MMIIAFDFAVVVVFVAVVVMADHGDAGHIPAEKRKER